MTATGKARALREVYAARQERTVLEVMDFAYCCYCRTPYGLQDLRWVGTHRYACSWHYDHGMR